MWVAPSGGRFWPLDPRAEEVRLEDIALHLSRIHRFGGASPMTIAQHSVVVSRNLPERFALQGLMHDAPEYVIGDKIGPLKPHSFIKRGHRLETEYIAWHEMEGRILDAVAQAVGFSLPLAPEVLIADRRACITEARDLIPHADLGFFAAWGLAPYPARVEAWPQEVACRAFLDRYQELAGSADFDTDLL